jgi:hypothetical protein
MLRSGAAGGKQDAAHTRGGGVERKGSYQAVEVTRRPDTAISYRFLAGAFAAVFAGAFAAGLAAVLAAGFFATGIYLLLR